MVASVLFLAGCGSDDEPVVGDEPITPEAIAAITQEHVDLEPRRIAANGVIAENLRVEAPAAWLEYAGVSLTVTVAPTSYSPLVCEDPSPGDDCVEDSVDGHDVTLAWQALELEEDPGVVHVIDRRAEEHVVVTVSGASITDDPRSLDLGVPLSDLAALATDQRLSLTTSQAVVDLGGDLDLPEPGPHHV